MDNNTVETKIEFTTEQQEKVNQLIKEAQGRAAKELQEKLTSTAQEVEQLKLKLNEASLKNKETVDNEIDGKLKEAQTVIEQFKAQVEQFRKLATDKEQELEKVSTKQKQTEKLYALERAAGSGRFNDLDMVLKDVEDKVVFSDTYQRYVVLSPEGHPRMNAALEPMSLNEFFDEYGQKKPYLVNPNYKGGIGSSKASTSASGYKIEEIFGKDSSAKKANDLYSKDPAEYKRLKTIAQAQGLIGS